MCRVTYGKTYPYSILTQAAKQVLGVSLKSPRQDASTSQRCSTLNSPQVQSDKQRTKDAHYSQHFTFPIGSFLSPEVLTSNNQQLHTFFKKIFISKEHRAGLNRSYESLPNQDILWFYNASLYSPKEGFALKKHLLCKPDRMKEAILFILISSSYM